MQKVYRDSKFRKWKNSRFDLPVDSIQALMECPPYFEEMPILVDYSEDEWEVFLYLQEVFQDEISSEDLIIFMQQKPKRRQESIYDYAERLERVNERFYKRDERREKRKEFWSKVLFDKEKKKNNRQIE